MRFGLHDCVQAPPEDEGGLNVGEGNLCPQVGVCTKRHKGFDDMSIVGLTPRPPTNKSRQTAWFFQMNFLLMTTCYFYTGFARMRKKISVFVFYMTVSFLHNSVFLLQPSDFFYQQLFILRQEPIWYRDIGFQGLFQTCFKTSFKSWRRRRRTCHVHTLKRVSLSISGCGKVHGISRFLFQPILVLAAQRTIPPLKELAFLLGTGQKHPVGVVFRATLLQHRGLAAEAQQLLSHLEDV